jgi:VWFA-related protein
MRTLVLSSITSPLLLVLSIAAAPRGDDPSHPKLELIPQRPKPKGPGASIRVDVNMTLVPVTVLDPLGRNVTGLSARDFRVFDDAEQRPIASFGQQDQPISVGLIFDCSRSMANKFQTARVAPRQLYGQLNDQDESFLVTVAERPLLRQGLTSDFNDIENALVFTSPDGSTSLLDGVMLGLAQIKKAHNPRRALVIVSDGGENNSRYTERELTRIAAEADTQIFTIGLHQDPQTPEEVDGPSLLAHLAAVSGGLSYDVHNLTDLGPAMARIGVTLHNQYVIGYYPPNNAQCGKYRKIRVEFSAPAGSPKLRMYARGGYYVPDR